MISCLIEYMPRYENTRDIFLRYAVTCFHEIVVNVRKLYQIWQLRVRNVMASHITGHPIMFLRICSDWHKKKQKKNITVPIITSSWGEATVPDGFLSHEVSNAKKCFPYHDVIMVHHKLHFLVTCGSIVEESFSFVTYIRQYRKCDLCCSLI